MSILKYKSQLANLVVSKKEKLKQWYRDHVDESKGHKLYDANTPVLDNIQEKVVSELNKYGIAIININDLFPDGLWWEKLSKEVDKFVTIPEVQEYVDRFKHKESTKGFYY